MTKRLNEDVTLDELGPSEAFQKAFDAITNLRHKFFLKHYWLDQCRNKKEAAIKAGYKESGASQIGTLILQVKEVREAMKLWLEEVEITPSAILAEFHRINNASLYDFRGLFEGKSLEELHESGIDLRQIKKLKVTRRMRGSGADAYEVEDVYVELYDRLKALVTQAKILKMFSDVGDPGLGAEAIIEAMAIAKAQSITDPDHVQEAIANNGGGDDSERNT